MAIAEDTDSCVWKVGPVWRPDESDTWIDSETPPGSESGFDLETLAWLAAGVAALASAVAWSAWFKKRRVRRP